MLQPSETSPEDGPSSTDVDTGDPVPARSTVAESEITAQRMESASHLQCGNNDAKLLEFFNDLSEEEWASFSLEMYNPASRAEFLRTCMNIARVVHLTSLNIVIPALYQMMDKDLQGRVLKFPAATRPSSGSSRSSHPSISFIEDDVDVMIMKNGVLSKIIPKRGCSRTSVRSSRSSLSLQHSPLHGSQTSLVDSKSTPLCDELKASFGLTKESVCHSVIQSLGKSLIDLRSQSLGPDLRDLSTNVVEEVVVSVFRVLKTSGQRGATVQETKDMIQKVSKELSESLAKKDAAKALVSPVEDETFKSALACTAEESVDAVIHTMEDCLDDGAKSKPAKHILAAIRKVVKVLACQSTSLEEFKADALTDTDNTSPSLEQICVSKKTQMLFSDEFHSKATLAISDVLHARGIHSALGINSCLTSIASPVAVPDVLKSKLAVISRSAPVLSQSLPQPVDSAAETVLPENSSDNEPAQILDSAAADLIGHFVNGVQRCELELSTLKRLSKSSMISATAGLYQNMQKKVRQVFVQWNLISKQAEQGTTLEDASASGPAHSVAVNGMSQIEKAVDPEASQKVEAIRPTDAQSPSPDIDECTKEIMTEILMLYKEQMAEGNCAEERYSVTSFLGSQLIDDIMSSLGEDSVPRPGTCIQEDVDDADLTLPIKKVVSSENFERTATAKVSQVLLKSTGNFAAAESKDSLPLPTQNAASDDSTVPDIVNTVVRGIEKLFHLRPSQDETDEAISILQGNKRPQNDRVTEIWCTAQNMLKTLEGRLKDFYHVKMPSCIRKNQRTDAYAKKAVSKVLVTLQEELPKVADFESSDELRLTWDIVNSMIDNVEKMEDENELGKRRASSLEAQRSKTPSSLSSTASPCCISVCPIVRHTYIDMSDTGSDREPTACITKDTLVKVAKVILTKLGLLKDNSASSPSCDDPAAVPKSVERVLSSGSIRQYSPSLTGEVYCLLLEGNKSPEAMALYAGKSASDSILLKVGRSEGACKKDSTLQLIKAYSLESVKYLLLPLFHFSSLHCASQDELQQASASRSCPSLLRSMTGEMSCQRASRSPSEILDVTVTLVSNILESEIMKANSLSAEMLENDIRPPSLDVDLVSLSPSSSSAVLEQLCVGEDKVTMPLSPVDSNNEDHNNLVTLLVVRLLTQVQGQGSLSDDMLDMSKRLIENTLHGFGASPGIYLNDTSAQVNIHKVYRAIYRDLEKQFGSENLVLKAMESQDSSFEETLIASLRRELMQTRTPAEPVLCPAPNKGEMEDDRKQPRRGIFHLLPKMPKINLKKFKIGVKKNNNASNKGKTTAAASSNTVSSFSSEEKPRRCNLFLRMISALTRKSASS